MEDLLPDHLATLLHLLTCRDCRSDAVELLLEHAATGGGWKRSDYEAVFGKVFEYDAVFERLLEASPEIEAEGRRRRDEAEQLLRALLQAPRRSRWRKIRCPRYRNPELLDLLLEEAHAQQLAAPQAAAGLAALGVRLAGLLAGEQGAAALSRALCLGVNARRLLGRRNGLEGMLGRAALGLEDPGDRAFYCRTAALLRWEQARPDEASALLQSAARLWSKAGGCEEAADAAALHGLLLVEQGALDSALPLLYRGWMGMDREVRPQIAQRVGLALAACLVEADETDRAQSLLEETWRLYSGSTPAEEMLRVYWAEARVLAGLGKGEEARHLLASVVERLLEEGSVAEAALAGLDLVLVLAELNRLAEVAELEARLAAALPAGSAAAAALPLLASPGQGGELQDRVRRKGVLLLRDLRSAGTWIKPLPYA
jgi:hypothetical protein